MPSPMWPLASLPQGVGRRMGVASWVHRPSTARRRPSALACRHVGKVVGLCVLALVAWTPLADAGSAPLAAGAALADAEAGEASIGFIVNNDFEELRWLAEAMDSDEDSPNQTSTGSSSPETNVTTTATTTTATTATKTTSTMTPSTTRTTSTFTTTETRTTSTSTSTYDRFKEEPFCGEELLAAVLRGDTEEVERYVILSQDLNCKTDYEYLLQLVLRANRREMSEFVAQSLPPGSNHTTKPNATGATPLLMAADKGYTNVVESLIVRAGVDVTVNDYAFHNVLHLAAPWPETSALVLRLVPGYKLLPLLYARDAYGNPPLHRALLAWANASVAAEAALALLQGAEAKNTDDWAQISMRTMVNQAGQGENKPAHLTSDYALLRRLSGWGARFDLTVRNGDGALPFHTVAGANGTFASGALAFVARFINVTINMPLGRRLAGANSNVDVRDNFGRTALHYAAAGGDPGNVEWLMDSGADPGLVDVNGDSPLAYGLRANQRQLVLTFAKFGGNPLTAIVRVGRLDILLEMVNQTNSSLSIDQRDTKTGRTAVFDAAESGQLDILKFFIDLGANLSHLDNNGYSVLAAAVNAHQVETSRMLMQSGAQVMQRLQNGTTALHVASAAGCGPCVEVLAEMGAAIDARNNDGQTPLHVCGSIAAAEALLRLDAASLSTPKYGLYPEHTAAFAGKADVLEVLLVRRHNAGNGVDVRSTSGDTPLHLASAGGHASTIELLLRWCAAVEATNREGGTPRSYASTTTAWSLLRDAAAVPGRCLCDCGPYTPGALYKASDWSPGCVAKVSCVRSTLGAGVSQVRCMNTSSDLVNLTNTTDPTATWSPAAPTFGCRRGITSRSIRRSGMQSVMALFVVALSSAAALASAPLATMSV